LRKYGYDDSLSTGSVSVGGTMGIIIPPSTPMIMYGIIAEQSIGRLFAEEESGRKMSMSLAVLMQENLEYARAKIISEGNATIIAVSGDALDAFEKPGQEFIQQWLDKNKSAAFDSKDYLNKLQESVKKHKE
jgi:translation initiation factor 2 beta subunit (eIF-2beta)/eIF-5